MAALPQSLVSLWAQAGHRSHAPGELCGEGVALTGPQLLLQEGDLFAQRVNAVQLLEGVSQEAAGVREPMLQGPRGQAVQWGKHQLQLLWAKQKRPSVPQGF